MSRESTSHPGRLTLVESFGSDGKPLSPEASLARKLLAARQARGEMLGTDLFGEPAWEMLLYLFVASERGEHVKAGALAAAAPVSSSSADRWLRVLEQAGHVVRIGDAADRDAGYIYLVGDTARRIRALLQTWG